MALNIVCSLDSEDATGPPRAVRNWQRAKRAVIKALTAKKLQVRDSIRGSLYPSCPTLMPLARPLAISQAASAVASVIGFMTEHARKTRSCATVQDGLDYAWLASLCWLLASLLTAHTPHNSRDQGVLFTYFGAFLACDSLACDSLAVPPHMSRR